MFKNFDWHFVSDLKKNIFLWTLKFWNKDLAGKKPVNYAKFEIASKQRKSII